MADQRNGETRPRTKRAAGSGAPDVSVIVITRNRAHLLTQCLDAIAASALAAPHLAVELVVVDNGSTDDTLKRLAAWTRTVGGLAVQTHVERRPGAGFARNTGIAIARGRLLVLTDDDCRLAKDYIATVHELSAADKGLTLRGGRVELGDARDLPFTIKVDREPAFYTKRKEPGGFLLGCNVALTRASADRIGPFDTNFGPGAELISADDTDFLFRAHLAGLAVKYEPSLVVFHHHGRRELAQIHRLFETYNIGNGAVFAKYVAGNPGMLRFIYWDLKHLLAECLGGASFMPELGLTYRAKVWGTFKGIWRYAAMVMRTRVARIAMAGDRASAPGGRSPLGA